MIKYKNTTLAKSEIQLQYYVLIHDNQPKDNRPSESFHEGQISAVNV
jgi:hypothetical protein